MRTAQPFQKWFDANHKKTAKPSNCHLRLQYFFVLHLCVCVMFPLYVYLLFDAKHKSQNEFKKTRYVKCTPNLGKTGKGYFSWNTIRNSNLTASLSIKKAWGFLAIHFPFVMARKALWWLGFDRPRRSSVNKTASLTAGHFCVIFVLVIMSYIKDVPTFFIRLKSLS